MSLAATQAAKIELRRGALATRAAVFAARGPAAAAALAKQVETMLGAVPPAIIAGYWPIGSELDCRPALARLHAAGHALALPVAGQRGDRLVFRRWAPGEPLEQGPFGTFHPLPSAAVAEADIVLVPLLAFDRRGHRLGYGAAYYDRTLNGLRAGRTITAWGLAFDEQEIDQVPAEPTDARLDGVITDKRLLRFALSR
jgi:5-formyltetrahydrofolate cyclo-ligase